MTQVKKMAASCVMVNLGWIVVLLATEEFAFLEFVFAVSRYVMGDAAGECVESHDIFLLGSLILPLFIR